MPRMVVIVVVARVIRAMIGRFIMRMIVPVLIQRQGPLRAQAKQSAVFRRGRDNTRRALAADVVV